MSNIEQMMRERDDWIRVVADQTEMIKDLRHQLEAFRQNNRELENQADTLQDACYELQQRADELENRERMLIMHCAALGVSYMDSDMSDLANDSWRSLHPDLQELINEKTKEYQPLEGV